MKRRICVIGPTYPYRGGIARATTLLTRELAQTTDTTLISFTRQYPSWLFPGASDKDPSTSPIKTEATYLLDGLNPLSWRRTLAFLKEKNPDTVILKWWHPYWAPAWAALVRGIKRWQHPPRVIAICHNVLPHEPSRYDGAALRLALSGVDGFVVHAESDRETLAGFFGNRPISHLPLPQFVVKDQPVADISVPPRPYLLMAGIIRPYKGLDVLLDALPHIRQTHDIHTVVAGEIWGDAKPYRDQIARLNLGQKVTLINQYIPDGELNAYIQHAAAVVLPYRSATQSGIVQMALGHERPVITTKVGGLAEAVVHEQTGLVVPPNDPAALAAAIARYFDEGLEEMFVANIEKSADRFAWSSYVEQLLAT